MCQGIIASPSVWKSNCYTLDFRRNITLGTLCMALISSEESSNPLAEVSSVSTEIMNTVQVDQYQ